MHFTDPPPKKTFTLLGLTMCLLAASFYGYEYYLRVAPSVMSFELKSAYGISDTGLGFLSAFFYFSYVPTQLLAGVMMDRFGPRTILSLATLASALGAYLFVCTPLIAVAQGGRFLLGFASAFAFVGVLKITYNWLPARFFAMMVGIATSFGMLCAIFGKIAMAYFLDIFGWQQTLTFSVLIGCALAFAIAFFLKNHPHKLNFSTNIETTHANPASIFQNLKTILSNKTLWACGIIGCLTFNVLSVFAEMWGDSFLIAIGYSKLTAAKGASLVFLGFGIGAPCHGWISDKLRSRRTPLWIGSALSALMFFFILLLPNLSIEILYCLLFLFGFFASVEVLIFAIANDIVLKALNATAISFTNMLVMLGGFALQPLVGMILDALKVYSGCSNPDIFRIGLSIVPIGLSLGSVIALCLQETHHKQLSSETTAGATC